MQSIDIDDDYVRDHDIIAIYIGSPIDIDDDCARDHDIIATNIQKEDE